MTRIKALPGMGMAALAASAASFLLAENRGALHGFVQESLPQVEGLVRDVRSAAREFQQLSHGLRSDPSQFFYKPVPAGVEIPP